MPVPNSFANVTTSIPLSQLDANFNTPITLGNTAIQLGNTVTTLNNMTLANVTISSGNVTITNVSVTTANVTTANIATANVTTSQILNYGTANGVAYLNTSKALTTGTALVFDGTNLGVGVTPTTRLHIQNAGDVQGKAVNSATTGSASWNVTNNSGSLSQLMLYGSAQGAYGALGSGEAALYSTVTTTLMADGASAVLKFATGGNTERMRLDSSGNLGLGVTPSAWSSSWKSMEFGKVGQNISGFTGADPLFRMGTNVYTNSGGTDVYASTGYRATQYLQYLGQHIWYNSATGTAGNAITFTQAMTLDASGRLLVGTTTAPNSTDIKTFINSSGGGFVGFAANGTAGGAIGCPTTSTLTLYTAAGTLGAETYTERARITSGGVLLVGTTTGQQNTEIAAFTNAGGGSIVLRIQRSGENNAYIASSTAQPFQVWDSGIVQRFVVTSAGTCLNTTGTYGTISDAKLKENIVDATPKLDELMKVRVRNYGLKSEPNSKYIGFVAQELREIFPAMIDEAEDEDDKGEKTGEVTLNVKTTVFIPMLVKAIQELNAKVEAQAAEIAALKGNA